MLLTGELDALNSVELSVPHTPSFRLSLQWLAEDGIAVKAGERVAEFDNSQLTSTLAECGLKEDSSIEAKVLA